MWRLQYVADVAVQPQLRTLSGILTVDQDPPRCRFKEAADQIDQRRFAGAGLPHDRHIGALRHMKVKVLQHILVAVRIFERYIPKGNIPV